MTQAALLDHVTKTIVARFHPKRIMVFGSHARGTAGPDSDLDVEGTLLALIEKEGKVLYEQR